MTDAPQASAAKVRLPRTFRAFQSRGYRFLWSAGLLSNVSRFMQTTLLAWLVLNLTDSPWLVALVGFFGMAPMLLLGLVGGMLADSVNRQRLLMATQSAGLVASLAMLAVLLAESERYWYAYPVILTNGVGFALEMPSRRSLIHDLLGRPGVTNGFALDSVAMSASRMLGPALAGALITVAGVAGGYVAVAAFHLVALALLVRLPDADKARTLVDGGGRMVRNLMRGLRYVRTQRTLMAVVMVTLVMNLFLFPYMHMVPVIARDVLHVGPGLMGVLQATDGLGALVGAVAIASLATIGYHGRLFLGGSMLSLAALLLFSLSPWYFASLPTLLVLGLGTAAFSTMQATIVMLVAREEMRGTALGAVSLAIGAGPFGALLVGGVAALRGPSFAVGLYAAIGMAGIALIALLLPALRGRIVADEGRPS